MYTASGGSAVSESSVKALFAKYKSASDIIDGEGVEKFFSDIEVDMMDVVTLVIMHAMGAQEPGKIEYSMFKKACSTFKVDSISKWKSIISDLRNDLFSNKKLHRDVYDFAFLISLAPGIKVLEKDIAIHLWPLLLKDRCQFLGVWIKFVESLDRNIIKKDEW